MTREQLTVAYAGRRAQALGGDPERLGVRIRELLAELQPTGIVGAAADGADLLVLEAALSLEAPLAIHIVLPTAVAVFAEESVEPAWRDRFAAVLEEVDVRGGTIRTLDAEPGETYREANQAIIDTTTRLGRGAAHTLAVVVASEGEGPMVEDLLKRAGAAGMASRRIDPSG